jgi:hypothetical protein
MVKLNYSHGGIMHRFTNGRLELNVVLTDDADNHKDVLKKEGMDSTEEFKSGIDIAVKVTVGKGQIYIDFPTVLKEIIYGSDPQDHDTEPLSITIDYFNDTIKVIHNGSQIMTGEGFDDNEVVEIVKSVSSYVEKK